MVTWLIESAMRLRRLVVAAVIAVLGLGLVQLQNAPVDVYPEFNGTQVEVQAEALGLSAQEVEQLITVPIEQDLLNGVPWLTSITSRSMPGLSAIDLVFAAGDRPLPGAADGPGADVAGQGAAQRRHAAGGDPAEVLHQPRRHGGAAVVDRSR